MNFKSLHMFGQYRQLAVAFGLLFTVAACSSDSADDVTAAERFVGNWELVDVADSDGNKLADFDAQIASFQLSFSSTGEAVIDVDYVDPSEADIMLNGTYTVAEALKTITLTVNLGVSVSFAFDFDFASDQRVTVSTSSIPLNLAFGTTLSGEAVITLAKI